MKVELMPGIQSLSGTLRVPYSKRGIVFKTYRSGKVYAYWTQTKLRKTPVTGVEQQVRMAFAQTAKEVARLRREGDRRAQKVIWAEVRAKMK